jgi:hypothetical protein
MLSGSVLIQAEVSSTAVAPAIRDLNGVERAEDVAGPHDIIAHVQASSPDKLGRLVLLASKPWTA